MSALDDLKAEVAATISVEQSAITLIQGIAQQLQDALANAGVSDPALIDLTTQLKSNADALAAAVSANTPAAPAPTPAPAPSPDTGASSTDTGTQAPTDPTAL